MTEVITLTENSPIVERLEPVIKLTEAQFFEFCQINRELRIERTASGEIIIMPPTGLGTGKRNFNLAVQLGIWVESCHWHTSTQSYKYYKANNSIFPSSFARERH